MERKYMTPEFQSVIKSIHLYNRQKGIKQLHLGYEISNAAVQIFKIFEFGII